ncbi:hypothetical protein Gotur_032922 [Gossypium turneri]
MSGMLPTVDFAAGTNNSASTSGIGWATKKVRTRPKVKLDFDDPVVDNNNQRIQSEILKASYKSTLLGASSEKNNGGFLEEEFTLLDGDVVTEVIEGVPSITFSNRVQEFIQRRMSNTVIVKLLRGRIGFNVLLNKINLLGNLQCRIQLIDLENDFYLVHFQDESNYNKVVWIRLPGLSEGYYSDCLLRGIGQTVGPVAKLDVHTDCACRGRFARLAVYVDLRKSLVSKVQINGRLQRIEYEALPNIYFQCGMYRHVVNVCPEIATTSQVEESSCARLVMEKSGLEKKVEDEPYGSWMVVERRKGRSRDFGERKNNSFRGLAGDLTLQR